MTTRCLVVTLFGMRGCGMFGVGLTLLAGQLLGEAPLLNFSGFLSNGWPLLSQQVPSNHVARLEYSTNLTQWTEFARIHGPFERFPDAASEVPAHRFYRASLLPPTSEDDWANHFVYPNDALLHLAHAPGVSADFLKFAILPGLQPRVYFHDSRYPFHYDFAMRRLDPFKGMSPSEFDAVSLHPINQQIVLGAVLLEWQSELPEIAVQFVATEPYEPAQVADWFDLIRAVIEIPPGTPVFYFPTYQQQATAAANVAFFQNRGINVGSIGQWITTDEIYAQGWALGRLVSARATEVDALYADGRLRPDDILLLDAVPTELPPVAGIIALAPTTPSSHAVLLAQSFGVPFVYLGSDALRESVADWEGQDVLLEAEVPMWFRPESQNLIRITPIEGEFTVEQRASLLEAKRPPPLAIPAKAVSGAISLAADGLHPDDIQFVGGKAANFGVLRRSLPANSPSPAISFTFDLWDAYLDQTLPAGQTLRAAVQEKLAGFAWPPDMVGLKQALAEVRELFTDIADFSAGQKAAILAELSAAGFDLHRKIRFRSSTNVEDSEQFSGAGLYDSFSGCLADELDDDTDGPSFCEANEPRERGVFRAMRKVYASFYSDNAYLERLRHSVNESQVGMALLVHHSTPDEFELANGVAIMEPPTISTGPEIRLVTQAGAVSVANPEPGGAWPEEVRFSRSLWAPNGTLYTARASSLVPIGGSVLTWDSDYRLLVGLLETAASSFAGEIGSLTSQIKVDFEYKKVAPTGDLLVKQIRLVPPQADSGSPVPTWLLAGTNRWVVHQSEHSDVFAHHRLKSSWLLANATARLDASSFTNSFLRRAEADCLNGMDRTNLYFQTSDFREFQHMEDNGVLVDHWRRRMSDGFKVFELRWELPLELPPGQCPVLPPTDARLTLTVIHPTPQVCWESEARTHESVALVLVARMKPDSRQSRSFVAHGIEVETAFNWWDYWPGGVGTTGTLQSWEETTITGLASRPIVLRGEYSQTYAPAHHNFSEDFIFDPHLEESMDPDILAELRAGNIRALVVRSEFVGPDRTLSGIWIWGFDETLRSLE
ncbi:MAG: hypothetical protein KJ072_21300 [Verrucomicrobia bacterium]|nr:hypothetical protein [Verrucomicrobiota bacterium]